jgi:hypothetical protein
MRGCIDIAWAMHLLFSRLFGSSECGTPGKTAESKGRKALFLFRSLDTASADRPTHLPMATPLALG